MANEVEKLDTIAILSIEKVNTLTDDNIEKINTLNFLGVPPFMTATGGTITTDGDYKVHSFTSSGTFTVTEIGASGGAGDQVQYLVIAGGGGGGANAVGGNIGPNDAGDGGAGLQNNYDGNNYYWSGGGGGGGGGCGGPSPARFVPNKILRATFLNLLIG